MTKYDKVEAMLEKIQEQKNKAMDLSIAAQNEEDEARFDDLFEQLKETENLLINSVFIDNGSTINDLIGEISTATKTGKKIEDFMVKVRDTVKELRAKVRGGKDYVDSAKQYFDQIDELTTLVVGS